MKSHGSGQITVRDINGSPGALTYAQLEGLHQGKQWPCPSQQWAGETDCGLTRACIPIFLVSPWRDLAKGQA